MFKVISLNWISTCCCEGGLKSVQSSFVYIFDICLRCSSINFNCWQGFYNRPHFVSIEKSLHDSFSRHFSRHCTPINISHKSKNWACAHLNDNVRRSSCWILLLSLIRDTKRKKIFVWNIIQFYFFSRLIVFYLTMYHF